MTEIELLHVACRQAGLDASRAELIRSGENAIYRLPGGVVARVTRTGQLATAAKEVAVARWLEEHGVDAVQPLQDVEQPIAVDDRAVTFWHELPPHTQGSTLDVAVMLRQLHRLPPPAFALPRLDPFVRIAERIEGADTLAEDDREWLREHLESLRKQYAVLPPGLPTSVVHGDAWIGNIAVTAHRRVLLDFERCSLGPPEWDLIQSAMKVRSFGSAPAAEYVEFVAAYGHDVTNWSGFPTLRDIRELRMTTMAAQMAVANPAKYHEQASHRLACLRGERGPRPWASWTPVP
ncbi:aminoglycoside phosphotransferase (APT) family kinase protein [Kibdelosporangium banguiense]|uniref:Aminoglycoside phosphotransferase (APT) family kinase protein n=1 Tax=Kibdelosporangium banguiense TaxID=1365924 RepID=A0ABS4TMZ3_9PSEU|nr:aminoglycoside phosphotransferase family protein [Kibdelosporangium banguiense]MBP2325359.1 aminoglycoside phosphotransferase (APT) family kinase protein [Kibdelosporangium banguiense]